MRSFVLVTDFQYLYDGLQNEIENHGSVNHASGLWIDGNNFGSSPLFDSNSTFHLEACHLRNSIPE